MAKTKSSKMWLQEHATDEYVLKAKKLGYRSRAAFKLLEIQEKDKILQPGLAVVDLGAAPGGWTQVVSQIMANKGTILAMDLLPMDSFEDVVFIQGDFREDDVLEKLLGLQKAPVDLVLSDMAPNISGNRAIDQPSAIYLAELALDFAVKTLAKNGEFLVKVFQGEGFDDYKRSMREHFTKVLVRKPKASRPRSREVYLLARGFKL